MIDLEKEREAFQEHFNGEYEYFFGECFNQENGYFYEGKHDKSAYFAFEAWKKCAESKQAEIDSLKAQLAKIESGEFVVVHKSKLNTCYWDEANNSVGYYELFDTLEEAKKAAAHYKATIEAGY
ncbi:hypothetical protein [Acinetobacter sp. V89_7]|uniref:hypothetical protein n=1 Tax=Acinetobacter sp. V89_7 TaxID=3044233 RepID=UPI00249EE3A6|nr:hypothetical protein [Acinetobacter sp. V89_7]MDI3379262.1 hypothetical protein [Acinetobacter sp. V89_7]